MKKFLAKISLFSLISLLLIVFSSFQAMAADSDPNLDALSKALTDVQQYNQWCIQETSEDKKDNGPDHNYIITIIEEPLDIESTTLTTSQKTEFEARICYRNYFAYTIKEGSQKGTEKLVSILAKSCSSDIKENKFATAEYKDYNIKAYCQPVQVYLSRGGTALITGYIATIYKWAASIVGLIAVTVIIISAIQISVSGGDTQTIDQAKGRIVKSLSGIAVLFLSGLILYTINPTFFT